MSVRKRLLAGGLAALLLLLGVFTPGFEGIFEAYAAENVALNKPVEASGVEVNGQWGPEMAVDGKNDADNRWSGGFMKGAHQNSDQWLIIDLKARATEVTSIEVAFHLKVWATKYQIQTSDSASGGWETLHTIERAASGSNSVTDTFVPAQIPELASLKRYVRFYFTELNSQAAGDAISVREITIMGTQTGAVISAQDILEEISELTVNEQDSHLVIPEVSDAYDIRVYGSEVDRVIGDDGSISPYRLSNRSFQVILQATSKTDDSDTAKKSFTVTTPSNTKQYPELFMQVASPNPTPDVLPAIQEWYGYEGDFILTKDTKIIVDDTAQADLMDVAQEFQQDIQEICGFALAIQNGENGSAGNIYLKLQDTDVYGTGKEGYFLINGENGIQIYSSTKTGVLYGTVTVEQMLSQDAEHLHIPKGVIRDYPLYDTRGIMFDVARIPTRIQFLQDYSKILKWYKLNTMQMHINDNQWSEPAYSPNYSDWEDVDASHRLESELFPSLATQRAKFEQPGDRAGRFDYYYQTHTGKDGELYYTKEEYRALEQAAAERGVKLIAELDTPGHSAAYTKYVYANQKEVISSLVRYGYLNRTDYLNADGEIKDGASFYIHNPKNFELLSINEGSGNPTAAQNARNAKIFMRALFDEYLGGIDGIEPLFTADTISAGVDEYWDKTEGNIAAAFGDYMNGMYDLLGKSENGYGKDVIMWGALGVFPVSSDVNKNIILEIWNGRGEDVPLERIADGFQVINLPQMYLYTTPGRYHKDMVREEYIYYNWEPELFDGNQRADKGEPLLKGAMAALWGDENREGITEADIHERYLRMAAILSEKTWGGLKEGDTFLDYEQKFDRLKEGPGTQIANHITSKTNLALYYDFKNTSADGGQIYDASGNGYHGKITGGETVTMDDGAVMMKFDGSTTIETPLRTLGYPYTMSFDIYLDGSEHNTKESTLFSGYDGRLLAAGINGELSLNRSYFAQPFGYTVSQKERRRITVVGTYQATKLYVDGVFQKLLYAAASDPDQGGSLGADTKATTDAQNNFRTTFVFPLTCIGKDFKGYLGNIRAYQKALSTEELAAEGSIQAQDVDVARNRGAYTDGINKTYCRRGENIAGSDSMRLYPAWKATDGDGHVTGATGVCVSNESRWNSSGADADFLMVDLGRTREISKVAIDWEASRYAASYQIMVSLDGKQWTQVKSVTGNTSAQTTDSFETVLARYVKMQGVARRSGADEYAIYEIKVYETADKAKLSDFCGFAGELLAQAGIGWESEESDGSLYQSYILANAVLADVMAGQEEIDEALQGVNGEFTAWIKQMLQSAVADAALLLPNEEAYTPNSWNVFYTAYEAAKKAGDDLSAEDLHKRLTELKEAQERLEKKPELPADPEYDLVKKNLKEALESAAAFLPDKASYTSVSWERFEKAYLAAQNPSAHLSVEDLKKLLTELKEAQEHLQKVSGAPADPGITPEPGPGNPSVNAPVALAAPVVSSVKSQKTGVKVTWKPVASASAYQLYRKIGSKVVKIGGSVTKTTAYDANPTGGKKMSYYVVALAGGKEGYLDSAAGSAQSIQLPKSPKSVSASQIKGKKRVTVKWAKVKKASSYLIYRAEGKKGAWKKIATVKKGTAYQDSAKLKKGKKYYYKVVAVSGKKYSPMKAAKKSVLIK